MIDERNAADATQNGGEIVVVTWSNYDSVRRTDSVKRSDNHLVKIRSYLSKEDFPFAKAMLRTFNFRCKSPFGQRYRLTRDVFESDIWSFRMHLLWVDRSSLVDSQITDSGRLGR